MTEVPRPTSVPEGWTVTTARHAVGLLLVLILTCFLVSSVPARAEAGATTSPATPLTVEARIADLQAYVPEQMEAGGVPGLAIALVQDRRVVWEAGFGVTNTLTGASVTENSVFEVASISKPVAAYAALKLVDSGALRLDKPLHEYFDDPWLPRSDWGDQITLRHVLSHTSGLSKRLHPLDKAVYFQPGERFSYSNVGFQYLQAAVERVTDSPFEQVARGMVFEPLAMESSSFADRPDVTEKLVSGHINYGTDLAPVFAALALCFGVIFLLAAGVQRVRKGRIVFTRRHLALFYAGAVLLALPLITWLNGGVNKWAAYFALVIAALSVWLWVWLFATLKIHGRLSESWRTRRRKRVFIFGSVLCCLVVFVVLANAISGPVPKAPPSTPGAAYSLQASAGDLARFMIEVSDPEHLEPETAAEVSTPQCRTSPTNSWGLGIGIYHTPEGDWLWHSGDNQDFHSLMVMQPETGRGVVVLANGQAAPPVVVDVARRAMGVDFAWSSSSYEPSRPPILDDGWVTAEASDVGLDPELLRDGAPTKAILRTGWGGQMLALFPELDTMVVLTGGDYLLQTDAVELVTEHILPAVR
jgi:CubicO group peptidase (beta-lactamase class C family)